jgi:hypothetical protein
MRNTIRWCLYLLRMRPVWVDVYAYVDVVDGHIRNRIAFDIYSYGWTTEEDKNCAKAAAWAQFCRDNKDPGVRYRLGRVVDYRPPDRD